MSTPLKMRAKKIGLPPGTLVHLRDKINVERIRITVIDYTPLEIVEKKDPSLDECRVSLNDPSITWIHICGVHDAKTIESLGKHFNLHPLMLEDIATVGQRAKLDNYKDNLFIVMRMLKYNAKLERTEDEQVSLILGSNYLISFCETYNDVFNSVRERLKNPESRIRQRGADYLCYGLIDCIVDHYFSILEKVDEKMIVLEDDLIKRPNPKILKEIQTAKREIIVLRKSVWPTREMISNLRRLESPLLQDSTKLYIQDVYDHTIQAIDTIESFRDVTSGMLDIYLSNISLRMNEIMKVLTIVATIFVPLTFIASVYGMNFEFMPELHWKLGYPMVLTLMATVFLSMIYYFRRKGWF